MGIYRASFPIAASALMEYDLEVENPPPHITPAMVEAGFEVLCNYDPGWSDDEECVRKIFLAMIAAQPPNEP